MASLMAMMGGMGGGMPGMTPAAPAGAVPFAAPAAPAPAADTRPPTEIYAAQLAQMHEMGLDNDEENIAALRSTQGNVSFAIERIMGNRGF